MRQNGFETKDDNPIRAREAERLLQSCKQASKKLTSNLLAILG